jgi:predicted ArsR family transcriptional regulator
MRNPPELTKTERRVLIELCRPSMSGKALTPPASAETIARALSVGTAAVRQHLGHLYDKFMILDEEGKSRRELLANEAMETGAVTPKDFE